MRKAFIKMIQFLFPRMYIYSNVHVLWSRRNEIYCGEIFFKTFLPIICSFYKLLNFMYFFSRLVKKDNQERFSRFIELLIQSLSQR